jgi:cobalt-zinc-cadmium efflux system outer membrane protein
MLLPGQGNGDVSPSRRVELGILSRVKFGIVLAASSLVSAYPQEVEKLDLDRAVEIALASNPALQVASARTRGALGLERQAGLRPNPSFIFNTENIRFWGTPELDASDDLDIYAYFSQPLEWRGKKARRLEVAAQDIKISEIELKGLQWRIRQDVRQSFLRALLAQKQLDFMRESGRYFDQIVRYHRTRVEQGAMPEADLIRSQLEREHLTVLEQTAAADAERSRIGLLKTMGVADHRTDFELVDTPQPPLSTQPLNLQALMERARANNPELTRAEAEIDRARAQLALQVSQAKPDWTVTFGYKRTMGYNTLLGGFIVPLPILNRNQGSIIQGQADVESYQGARQVALTSVESSVLAALATVRQRHAMIQDLQKGMVQRADEFWRISEAAYQEGGVDILRLIDAQRVRNEARLLLTNTEMEYRISMAELESAVGEENIVLSEELLRGAP